MTLPGPGKVCPLRADVETLALCGRDRRARRWAAKPDFAKDLYVANAAHSTDGDFVTIASTTDKNLKEYLSTRETVDGYSISNIQWSDGWAKPRSRLPRTGSSRLSLSTKRSSARRFKIQSPDGAAAAGSSRSPLCLARPNANVQTPIQRPMPVPQIPTPPPHTASHYPAQCSAAAAGPDSNARSGSDQNSTDPRPDDSAPSIELSERYWLPQSSSACRVCDPDRRNKDRKPSGFFRPGLR